MSLENMSQEELALAQLMRELGEDPETRLGLQALIKKKHPNVATPDLDAAVAMRQLNEDRKKDREEFEAFKAESKAKELEMTKWGEAIGAGHCTYDDIENVKKFMTENGLTEILNGARLWKQEMSLATPTNTVTNVYEMPTDHLDSWRKGGNQNLARTALREAHSMIDEIRSGKVKIV